MAALPCRAAEGGRRALEPDGEGIGVQAIPELDAVPPTRPVSDLDEANPQSLTNAMARHISRSVTTPSWSAHVMITRRMLEDASEIPRIDVVDV